MGARKWIALTAASAAVLAVVTNWAPGQAPESPTQAAAVVNGETITYADVEAVLKLQPPTPAPPSDAQRRQTKTDALAMLIDDLIMQQFLRKNGPPADAADVQKQLQEMEASLKAENQTLEDYYKKSGQTEAQLRNNITNMVQWTNYVRRYLGDQDILKYYNQNKDFFDQVTVRASHILVRLAPNPGAADVEAGRAKLQALRQDIVAGKIDFAEAAKKYSQCPSAPHGGDIGYFPRKWAVDESFAKVAFSLQKGEISDVVQTEYGLHLIKVTDRKAGQPSEFEKIKDEVREIAAEDMRQTLLAEQRKLAKVVVNMAPDQGAKTATP